MNQDFEQQYIQQQDDLDLEKTQMKTQKQTVMKSATQFLEKSTIRLALRQQEEERKGMDEEKIIHYLKIGFFGFLFLLVIYIISYIIYNSLLLVQSYIIIALILTAWYFIWAFLASLGFFVGQFWFVKRPILMGINSFFPFDSNFNDLKNIIEYIQKPNMDPAILADYWQKAKMAIQLGECLQNLRNSDDKNLTTNQNIINDEIIFVMDNLKKLPCQDKNKISYGNLYELLSNIEKYDLLLKNVANSNNFIRFDCEPNYIQQEVIPKIQSVVDNIILCQKTNQEKSGDYFFNFDPLVNFKLYHQFMKVYLNSEYFCIQGNDKKKIDCVYIPTNSQRQPTDPKKKSLGALNKVLNMNAPPIMMIFNKNSCYFEQEAFGAQVKFYIDNGISVVSINYRGYGDSEGTPQIQDIEEDCENLVRYIKQKYKPTKLGVNGWSMGGMFSTYIANKCNLDFLLADRTFSRPCEAARFLIENQKQLHTYLPFLGKFSNFLLKNLPYQNWDKNSGKNFVQFRGPKLLSYDPNDEIIPFPASLFNAVTNELFDKFYNTQFETGIKKIFTFDENRLRLETIGLSKDFMKKVYSEINYITDLINIIRSKSGQIGNGIEGELKRLLEIIKIDRLSLWDVLNFDSTIQKAVFKQFLINIIVYNFILDPSCQDSNLQMFLEQLQDLPTAIQAFQIEQTVRNRLSNQTVRVLEQCFTKIRNLHMEFGAVNDESPPELRDHQTKIFRVDLGHNTYYEGEHWQILKTYLENIGFYD